MKDSDISKYKLLNVREQAIDDRQSHLDLMCFPNLFPTGRFGENYPRQEKLDFTEYVKSRLLNKDSRFRKTSQYVFRLKPEPPNLRWSNYLKIIHLELKNGFLN